MGKREGEGKEEREGGRMRLVRSGWGLTPLGWRELPRQRGNWTNQVDAGRRTSIYMSVIMLCSYTLCNIQCHEF